MARYRIIEKEVIYTDYAKPGNPDKKGKSFEIQIRKRGKWCAPWEKGHQLWRLSDTLEEAQERIEKFVENEKREKIEKKNPKIAYRLNTGWF